MTRELSYVGKPVARADAVDAAAFRLASKQLADNEEREGSDDA